MLLELDALDTESLLRLTEERLVAVRVRRFVSRPLRHLHQCPQHRSYRHGLL
jgi:hypothetical protein